MNRRALLRTAALLLPAIGLASCSTVSGWITNPSSGITFTQDMLNKAGAVLAGLNNLLGSVGLLTPAQQAAAAVVVQDVATYIGSAEALLSKITAGSLVPPTTVQGIFTDLETAATAVATIMPGNPILMAVEVALPILATLWGLMAPAPKAGVMRGAAMPSAADAFTMLRRLPQPAFVRG